MIEQSALDTPMSSAIASTWRTPLGRIPLTAIGAMAHHVTSALRGWARVPLLPYATLWEASVLVSLLKKPEHDEPDPFSTELPFLTDSWPRE